MTGAGQMLLRIALIISVCATYSPSINFAQTPPLWGDLKSGSHAVGFKFLYRHDYSRNWKAMEDANGYPQGGERRRPIRINVWYPARNQSNASRMLYRDYMPSVAIEAAFTELNGLLENRDVDNLRRNIEGEAAFNTFMTTQMAAIQNAVPQDGAFPLIVYSAGLNNSSHDNVVMCEYLASYGFVVITVPQLGTTSLDANLKLNPVDVETQVQDLQYAIGAMQDFPNVDRENLGALGYSVGGVAALTLVMRNIDVDAAITLDPTFGVAPFIKMATESPFYNPARMRIPWLYVYRVEPATSLAVFDALKYSDRYRLEFTGMLHQDFSSSSMIPTARAAVIQNRTTETARRGYQATCRYILNFFNAYLKKDARAVEFITRRPEENGVAESVVIFEIRSGTQAPPTEEKFIKIIERDGVERAAKVYREFKEKEPQPIFSENFLNNLGYRLINEKRLAEAIEIFKLNVEAYPASANVYDSLAEAYMLSGNKEMAIKYYRKSIELNPDNKAGIETLKKLEGEQ